MAKSRKSIWFLILIAVAVLTVPFVSAELLLAGGSFVYEQKAGSGAFIIGDYSFSSSRPLTSCSPVSSEGDFYDVGRPSPNCWSTTITFDDQKFLSVNSGDRIILNEFLAVTLKSMSGSVDEDGLKNWKNIYEFEWISDPLSLSVSDNFILERLGSEGEVIIVVDNFMSEFDGSFIVITKEELLESSKTEEIKMGVETFTLNFDNNFLGEKTVSVFAKIEVGNAVFILDNPATFSTYVIPAIGETPITSTSCVSDSDCPQGFSCTSYSSNGESVRLCVKESGASSIEEATSDPSSKIYLIFVLLIISGIVLWGCRD